MRRRLVDFADERVTRVDFSGAVGALHRLRLAVGEFVPAQPGIGYSRVNFPRKEVSITFENSQVKLSEVVALLASLGYGPEFEFSDLEDRPRHRCRGGCGCNWAWRDSRLATSCC